METTIDLARAKRIRQVIEEFVRQSNGDASFSDEDVLKKHPDLLPELAQQLRSLKPIKDHQDDVNATGVQGRSQSISSETGEEPPTPTADDGTVAHDVVRALHETIPVEYLAPKSRVADPPRRLLGDYEILEVLGQGGMGVVYKARHRKLGRLAAVKLIRAARFVDSESVQRFQQEAQAAAQLDHPAIVPVYEVNTDGQQHFMALAFVDGDDLWKRIKESPLPPREAADVLRKVAEGMQYAHERGIVHRDLKPQNILLSGDLQPRITDFGLAKRMEGDSGLTATGQVMGTPSYMPPEQALGQNAELDARTDVYSLGATLYCALVGRPPFQAATPLETLKHVVEQDPAPPRTLNPSVPRDLETICLKCLQKNAASRYVSALALKDDLERFLEGRPILARRSNWLERGWRWAKREPWKAGTAAIAATVAVLGPLVIFLVRSHDQGSSLVNKLLASPTAAAPTIIDEMKEHWAWVKHPLQQAAQRSGTLNETQKHNLDLALLGEDHTLGPRILTWMKRVEAADQGAAALVLCSESQEWQSDILKLIVSTHSPAHFRALMPAITLHRQSAIQSLKEPTATAPHWGDPETLHKGIDQAAQHANAAVALHQLGESNSLWTLLAGTADPTARSFAVNRCAPFGCDVAVLVEGLRNASDGRTRHLLLTAIGKYEWSDVERTLNRNAQNRLLECLRTSFESDGDAGVHAAAHWTMQRWNRELDVIRLTERLAGRVESTEPSQNWAVMPNGFTLVRIDTPGTFTMGSPLDESGRYDDAEEQRPVNISHSYWISSFEVTAAQLDRFQEDERPLARDANGLPATGITWNVAAAYCNWLSKQSGIPEQEWCYRVVADGVYEPVNDTMDKSGYRMPTEAEWEFACRAGTAESNSRFFGQSEADLVAYAWYAKSFAADQPISAQPIGQLLPNTWGLFDLYGNVVEWCHIAAPGRSVAPPAGFRPMRGGSYGDTADSLRTAAADFGMPDLANSSFGFRVAKTIVRQLPSP